MKSITEIQTQIVHDFLRISDEFDRCVRLIELGQCLPPLLPEKRSLKNLVEGCQSRVWIDVSIDKGRFYFDADSETLIAKGILYLLRMIFSGQCCSDVSKADVFFLQESGIMNIIDLDRQNGIGYIINTLKIAAEKQ